VSEHDTNTHAAAWESALILANPIAGKGRGAATAEAVASELQRVGVQTEIQLSEGPGDITRFSRERGEQHGGCVSIGGDGTLAEVLEGLRELPELPVAPFPTGTANVLSKDLGLARTPAELAEAVLSGHTVDLDVARVKGSDGVERTSFLVVGVGLDGMVIHDLDERRTGPITKLSYLPPVLRALAGYKRPRLSVCIDGEEVPGEYGFVLVSNCIHYGGAFTIDPERDAGDGLWEVVLLKRGDFSSILAVAARGLMGGVEGGACTIRRGREITISSPVPVPFQLDGGRGAHTPLSLQVSSRPHRILVPAQKRS